MSQESTGRKKTSKPTSKPKNAASEERNDTIPEELDYYHDLGQNNLDLELIKRSYSKKRDEALKKASQSQETHDSDSDDMQQFSALKNTIADNRKKEQKGKKRKPRSLTPPSQYYKNR